MFEPRRSFRPYPLLAAMAIAGATMPVPEASARLPEAIYSLSIRYVDAIHHPTGCAAMLEYDDTVLLGAFIIDPLCLPRGIEARPVPAFRHDFHVEGARRRIPRGR